MHSYNTTNNASNRTSMMNNYFRHACLGLFMLTTSAVAGDVTGTRVTLINIDQALTPIIESAPATVISLNQGIISAQLAAQIERYHVDVGSRVDKGDILVSLDCREATQKRNIAKAALVLAEKANRRAQSLSSSQSIAEQNLNEADASLKRAKAENTLANIEVSHCRVTAPFDGIVTKRWASKGELASEGKQLLTIVDTDNIELSAQLNPRQTATIGDADSVFLSNIGESLPVALRTVLPIVDSKSHTVETRLKFRDQVQSVGQTGRIQWSAPGRYLSTRYIQQRGETLGYFVAAGNHAAFIPLPSATLGTPALISPNEQRQLVMDGRHVLVEGSALNIVEKNK